ncbi:PQ-loop repeat-containing protein [Patescibacteria group bacterium]|nr:PQ-loop repeat-containing protein [Patescibacteria group bacterium]
MLTIAAVIGFLTVALSILVKVIGFPDQIRKNFKRKSTEGLSTYFYVLWTTHGFFQKDRVLILG